MIKKITDFFKNVYAEMRYVTWPSKADIKEGTTVVIIMSAIVAVFLALVDAGFGFFIKKLLMKG